MVDIRPKEVRAVRLLKLETPQGRLRIGQVAACGADLANPRLR